VVGVVEDGRAMVAEAKKLRPDVIVADISMPHLNGIEALPLLKKDNPDIKVVFLTMHQNAAYARRALQGGASGFVLKHSAPDELVVAIRASLNNTTFLAPVLTSEVLQQAQHGSRNADDPRPTLTPRQREILQLVAEGRSAKKIEQMLSISARTVEFHKYQIMDAHGLHSSAELIHFAIKHGIVTI